MTRDQARSGVRFARRAYIVKYLNFTELVDEETYIKGILIALTASGLLAEQSPSNLANPSFRLDAVLARCYKNAIIIGRSAGLGHVLHLPCQGKKNQVEPSLPAHLRPGDHTWPAH